MLNGRDIARSIVSWYIMKFDTLIYFRPKLFSPIVILFYDEDRGGTLNNTQVGVIGAYPQPHRLTGVETLLNGHAMDDGLIRRAAATAAEEVDPPDDLHADATYRRGLVATLIERGLRAAAQRGGA